jgi:hypothetical protein
MPTWGEILKEVEDSARKRGPLGPDRDAIRLKYLKRLHDLTGRAVISYGSAWLSYDENVSALSVEGNDVHAMMECCYGVKQRKLDLIIHSPGGSAQSAEQVIEYLRTQFDEIRAIIPLQAKSAATMMALGCDEIVMANHSELGPIDPQILIPTPEGRRFAPAHGLLRDFRRAQDECATDVSRLPAWTPILRSYVGLLEFCIQQVELSMDVVANWLDRYMLRHVQPPLSEVERRKKAREIAEFFGSEEGYTRFRTHSRPIRMPALQALGLRVRALEDDDRLQDAVLSVFHINEMTLRPPIAKVVENHLGKRLVRIEGTIRVMQPQRLSTRLPQKPRGPLARLRSLLPFGARPPSAPTAGNEPGAPSTP